MESEKEIALEEVKIQNQKIEKLQEKITSQTKDHKAAIDGVKK